MKEIWAELAARKLVIVTGKGGTGKTLFALALAHRLSRAGKRVWLVELGRKRDQAFSRLPELLGVDALGHEPKAVRLPGGGQIHASLLDPTQSLAEYVKLKLPVGGLAGILLNNRVTASFLEVVPGLPELVSLGKLWYAATQSGEFDCIVLDAPATGHALPLLKAPANFKRLTKAGPIYRDASLMVDFLADPAQAALVFTTLPEEMPIQETLELTRQLKEFPEPYLVANKCFPPLPPLAETKDSLPYHAYEYSRARAAREQAALKILPAKHRVELPFFFPEPGSPPLFTRIAEAL